MDYAAESLRLHYEWAGKIDYVPKMSVKNREALSWPTLRASLTCLEIHKGCQEKLRTHGAA